MSAPILPRYVLWCGTDLICASVLSLLETGCRQSSPLVGKRLLVVLLLRRHGRLSIMMSALAAHEHGC